MSWFKSKPQEPPKPKPVKLELAYINMQMMKTKEYAQILKDKKLNEAFQSEKGLIALMNAPVRNRKDEEVKITQIVRILNEIEACDRIIQLTGYVTSQASQLVASQGDPSKIQQTVPYLATLCYIIDNISNPRGMEEFKNKMTEYFHLNLADHFKQSVDPQAQLLFQLVLITSPNSQKYVQDLSAKTGIQDVPGLPMQRTQPQQQQYSQNPNQYQQQYQQPYLQPSHQQSYQQQNQWNQQQNQQQPQYSTQNSNQQSQHSQQSSQHYQNIFQNNPQNNLPHFQPPVVYPKLGNNSTNGPKVQQFQTPQGNINYPGASIYNQPPPQQLQSKANTKQDDFNFAPSNDGFVPLGSNTGNNKGGQGQYDDIFAKINQAPGFVPLSPEPPNNSQSTVKSQGPNSLPDPHQLYKSTNTGDSNLPSNNSQSNATFGPQQPNNNSQFNANATKSNDSNLSLSQHNQIHAKQNIDINQQLGNPMELTGLLQTNVLTQGDMLDSAQLTPQVPVALNHDLRSLELLQQYLMMKKSQMGSMKGGQGGQLRQIVLKI